MRPLGFHPGQRLAHLLGGTQPACPVECGHESLPVAVGAPAAMPVETGDRNQATKYSCLSGGCGFPGACGTVCFWSGDDAKGQR